MQQGQGEDGGGVLTGAGSSAVTRDQSWLGDPHNGRRMTRVGGADGRVLGGVVSRISAEKGRKERKHPLTEANVPREVSFVVCLG